MITFSKTTAIVAAAGFVASAALAFPIARAASADATEPAPVPAASPEPGDGLPTSEAILQPAGDGLWASGLQIAEAAQAARVEASELGLTIGGPASGAEEDAAPSDPERASIMPAPSGDSGPEPVADTCAADTPPDDCPSGIRGVVLGIRALPDIQVVGLASPPLPEETGFDAAYPQCRPAALLDGQWQVGVGVNRPAYVTTRYAKRPLSGEPIADDAWRNLATATSPSEEADFWAWVEDVDAPDDDPRAWIDHCVTLDGLEPGTWEVRITVNAADDTTEFAITDFVLTLPGEDGAIPEQVRRATTHIGIGPDQLWVNAPHPSDQFIAVQAVPYEQLTGCSTGADDTVFTQPRTHDRTPATIVATTDIDADLLAAPDYPYLPTDDQSTTARLDLVQGTNYFVCVYWLQEGPTFDPIKVMASEVFDIRTPYAWQPQIALEGAANVLTGVESVGITALNPECSPHNYVLSPRDNGAIELDGASICQLQGHLTDVEIRGLPLILQVVMDDGSSYASRVNLHPAIMCRYRDCPPRANEVALVHLPDVPVEPTDCGTGFGTGCLSDTGRTRSAGDLVVSVSYGDRTLIDGAWVQDEPEPFLDNFPEVGETPKLSVTWDSPDTGSTFGRLVFDVQADQPVTTQIELFPTEGEEWCAMPGGTSIQANSAPVERATLRFQNLCQGVEYLARITATNDAGNAGVLWVGGAPRGTEILTITRTARVVIDATTQWNWDQDIFYVEDGAWSAGVNVRPSGLSIYQDTAYGPTRGSSFGWDFYGDEGDHLNDAGWDVVFGGGGFDRLCGTPESRPLGFIGNGQTNLGTGEVTLSMRVQYWHTGDGHCSPRGEAEVVRVEGTTTLDELTTGTVVLTSADGTLSVRVRARILAPTP